MPDAKTPESKTSKSKTPDAKTQPSTNPITELKVSAHLMTMEDGLFCVFNTPGSVPPDAATGLPGVRITAAPGHGGLSGQVGISGFDGQGWLGGDAGAALVRITGGPAQVLVTIYQSADGAHDAPKLQVIRLSDQPTAQVAETPEPAEEASPAQPDAGRPVEVAAHIYGLGDVGGRLGEWMGEPGSKRWVEGFGLAPSSGIGLADIEYQAVLGRGWLSPWAEGGQFCGSRGMSLPILGLRVRLRGAAASAYTVLVSATFVDGTQVGPVADGGAVEAPSLSPLEAFQVTLQPVGAEDDGDAEEPAPAAKPGRKPARAAAAASAPAMPAVKPGRAQSSARRPAPPPAAPAATPAKPSRAKAGAAPEPAEPAPAPPAKPGAKAPAKRTPATTRRR